MDSRISNIHCLDSTDGDNTLQDFQHKQKDIWRILNHIHSTYTTTQTTSPLLDNKENKNESESNLLNNNNTTQNKTEDSKQNKHSLTPSKSKQQGPLSASKTKTKGTTHGEDISSANAADIQTLLLQQKVYSCRSTHTLH